MVGGYTGKILRINLTNGNVRKENLDFSRARKFLGGRGLAAKILFDELPPKIDPLAPENKILYGTGPVTGCPAPGSGRLIIVTKSPLTGLFLDTYAGGNFAPELKFAGYDFVIVEGRAEKRSYISINDDAVDIKDASKLWGTDCWQGESLLKKMFNDENARVVVIGPAGERLVKFSVVSTDYYHQCGRGGAGAVMGSKNLKGIVVRGSKGINVAKPEELMDFLLSRIEWMFSGGPYAEVLRNRITYGTPLTMDYTESRGILPTKNFQLGQFDGSEKIDCYAMKKTIVVSDKACFSCNMPCGKYSLVKEGVYKGARVLGPEYETLAMFGSNLGNDCLEAIVQANVLCDRLGIDTVSCGNVIGFIMECYEKGIVTQEEVEGLDLKFGNIEAALELIRKIAYREGIGELLAEGVKAASEKIGRGSEKFAMHVKKMEYPGYEPRSSPAFALLYAITDRGACHRRAWPVTIEDKVCKPFVTDGRAKLVKELYDERLPLHCGCVCDRPYGTSGMRFEEFASIISDVTGWDVTVDELRILADRVASLVRSFNVREGFSRANDGLALRTMGETMPTGPGQGHRITKKMLDRMLDEYYELRGWDKATGIPTYKTLKTLGLKEVADELVELGFLKP